jgi:hypothetical protein
MIERQTGFPPDATEADPRELAPPMTDQSRLS